MTCPNITHVIFDYDGIIQDTERIYSIANNYALEKFGSSFNNTLKAGMMGRKRSDAVQWLIEQTGLAGKVTSDEYNLAYEQALDEMLPKAPLLPGVSKLISHLKANGVPIAVCTGSDEKEWEQKTRNLHNQLKEWSFEVIVLAGSDVEVKLGKPAPDPYLITMKRFREQPKSAADVLVFEDSINGARSGLAAGCKTVFIPQMEFQPHDWEERISDIKPRVAEQLTSMEEFVPEKYGLPSY